MSTALYDGLLKFGCIPMSRGRAESEYSDVSIKRVANMRGCITSWLFYYNYSCNHMPACWHFDRWCILMWQYVHPVKIRPVRNLRRVAKIVLAPHFYIRVTLYAHAMSALSVFITCWHFPRCRLNFFRFSDMWHLHLKRDTFSVLIIKVNQCHSNRWLMGFNVSMIC